LTYNGEAIHTLAGTGNEQEMYAFLTTAAEDGEGDHYYEDVIEHETPDLDKTMHLIDFNACMREEYEDRVLEFQSIELIEYSEEFCTFQVVINYSGLKEGDILTSMLYDAFNEIYVDIVESTTGTEGTVSIELTAATANAPFTFTAGAYRNGNGLFHSGIHVDGEMK